MVFRRQYLSSIDHRTPERAAAVKKMGIFSGAELRQHDAEAAERVLASGMKALGVTDEFLANQIKGSPEKYALAWLVRKKTCVRNGWIKQRLKMGSATNFSDSLRRVETAKKEEWGYAAFECIKTALII